MFRIITILALLGSAVSGCAWTTDTIDVPYQSAAAPVPIARAASATVAVTASDARETHRDRVSSKKNGFGMEAAPIVATNDIVATVRSAVERELSNRGFRIGPGQATIAVAVRRFYSDFKVGFFAGDAVADFDAFVTISQKDGALAFSQVYSSQGVEPDIQLATGSNARAALVKAMSDGVQKIVSDPALIEAVFRAQVGTPTARR